MADKKHDRKRELIDTGHDHGTVHGALATGLHAAQLIQKSFEQS